MPDKTEEKQRKFQKGKSGNPFGRPKGIRNKATLLAEALLQTEVEAICRKAIEEAKNGNIQAIKIILDRILPPKKESPIHIALPLVQNPTDILKATQHIVASVGRGEITPGEGEALSRIIDVHAKAIEMNEFEKRLKNLEERQQNNEKCQ